MSFSQHALGMRLRSARENCGLTQQAAAEALGLPRPAISQIETGNRSVSTLELSQLAELYHRSVAEFFGESPDAAADPIVALYRQAPGLKDDDNRRRQVTRCLEICQAGRELEQFLGQAQRGSLPRYPLPAPRNAGEAVRQGERVAAQERQRLNLGNAPILDMADLLNEQGVWASGVDLPTEISGLFLHRSSVGLAILVNFSHVRARKRFSYAHEYAHALLDRDEQAITVSSQSNASELVEKRANAFAAAFLIPSGGVDEVLSQFDKGQPSRQDQLVFDVATGDAVETQLRPAPRSQTITFKDVAFLAHHFGVSYQAACYRLLSLNLLSRDRCQALLAEEANGRDMLGYLCMLDDLEGQEQNEQRDRELKSHVTRLAIDAYRLEKVSRGRFLELMKLLELPGRDMLALAEAAKAD